MGKSSSRKKEKRNRARENEARTRVLEPHAKRVHGLNTRKDIQRERVVAVRTTVSPPAPVKRDPREQIERIASIFRQRDPVNEPERPAAPGPETYRQNRRSRLSFATETRPPQGEKQRAKKPKEHASSDPALRDDKNSPTCKPRPHKNRGSGGSREFIPWCDTKR